MRRGRRIASDIGSSESRRRAPVFLTGSISPSCSRRREARGTLIPDASRSAHRLRYWLFRVLGRIRSGRATEGEFLMASKLYVGGLSYSTTGETLREYFSQCGTVESASVITDKFSGQSRGFGFIEMSTAEEAQRA